MTCASCVSRVEKKLQAFNGVLDVRVNLASEKATIEYMEGAEPADLRRAVKDAGYELGSEAETLDDVTTASQRETLALRKRLFWPRYSSNLLSAASISHRSESKRIVWE